MILPEGIEWRRIYWVQGVSPKGHSYSNSVKEPPCNGYQSAFVIRGEKSSTIFCPFSFMSFRVPTNCDEIQKSDDIEDDFRFDWMEKHLTSKWKEFQGFGFMRDYDVCALIMRKFHWEVPAQVMTGGEEDTRVKGGKQTEETLKKPVPRDGKRGKFLQWFLKAGGSQSIREAMIELEMKRNNVLSYLYMLQKDHGIGYVLVGDIATVTLPEGCEDPFDPPLNPPKKEDDNFDWLDD